MINITDALTEVCPFCNKYHQIERGFDMHFGNNWCIVVVTGYC
jgi:hypothetical protein